MPGNNQAITSAQFGVTGTPKEPQDGEMEPRTLGHGSCLPSSLHRTELGLGQSFTSSTPARATAGTGRSQSSQPHVALGGGHGRVEGWGVCFSAGVSLRPGSKEDTELSCTRVRAKLVLPPLPPSLTLRTPFSPHTPKRNTKLEMYVADVYAAQASRGEACWNLE